MNVTFSTLHNETANENGAVKVKVQKFKFPNSVQWSQVNPHY